MLPKPTHLQAIGQIYHQFKLLRLLDIPELQCQVRELVHLPTGAQVMHIANEDAENMFCLSFQTLPSSSNGVAHILEHTVLCGSKKFPVKDPFFAMQGRSLNTFMNALTGSDFTCYPAASQVSKDFYNLLDVYIDAVFRPNLKELSFLQEGCRIEPINPEDPNSALEYRGVVYNEMKGALGNPTARLSEAINQALFPDLTYGYNSGGDPKHIPELSYEELRAFHQTYYHPSRCLFFFYGNMPLEGHLDFIAENILNESKPAVPLPAMPKQRRFESPRRIEQCYPIAADEETKDQTLIAFAWLTCHILEQQELLALSILEIILLDTDASPLKRAFLRSGLCKQVSCYLETDISEAALGIILRGCNAANADELEQLLRKMLSEIADQGISLDAVENAMHQLEIHRSEITGDHAPFGLSLFMRAGLLKQHGGMPEDGLKIHSLFEQIHKRNLEDPQYFPQLIRKYLLDNPHFVRVVLKPSKELAAQEIEEELSALIKIKEKLSEEQWQLLARKKKELESFQKKQEKENFDILPRVTLDDVPKLSRTFPLQREKIGNLDVYTHNCFTNEIVYADLIFDLPKIKEADLPYVRLFSTLLSQMGCNGRNYAENLEYIQAHTGGVGASLTLNLQATDTDAISPSFYIRGKALHRKMHKLFPLLHEMAASPVFNDVERLKEVIHKQFTGMQSSLNQNALRYSINLSASGLDLPSKIANAWYGLDYYQVMRDLAQNFDRKATFLVDKLQEMQKTLLCLDNPHMVITADASIYDEIRRHQFYGLQDLETKPFEAWESNFSVPKSTSQGRIISSPVAFVSKVLKTIPYVHADSPALSVAAFLFDNLVLHPLVREQGGAYGGGAVSNSMAGNFYFYSYRDPSIYSTVEAFKEAVQHIIKGKFEDYELEEAKLEMIQAIDNPVAPGSRGDLAYGWLREGKTLEVRQAFRDRLLGLNRAEVMEAVKSHILTAFETAATVVFAGKELLEKENKKFQNPLILESV